jgi:hypothetical protein
MGTRGMLIGYWWESQGERDHWEDQDEGGRRILKYKIYLASDRDSCEHGNEPSGSIKCWEVLE